MNYELLAQRINKKKKKKELRKRKGEKEKILSW